MNRAVLRRGAGLAFAVVMATSTPSSCDTSTSGSSGSSSSAQRHHTQVRITADDACDWTATIDGTEHKGHGNHTYELSGRTHAAKVVKRDGAGGITLTIRVDGRTVGRSSVKSSGRTISVESHS